MKKLLSPLFKTLVLLFTLSFISACGSEGGMDKASIIGTPESTATNFFYALYRDKDIKKMQKLSTRKMQRLLDGYGSINGITRNMLNMQFDTVEIEIERSGNIRESYGDKATISLIFTGTFNGNKISDLRQVKLLKREGNWLVEKVKDDPYAR